MVDIINLGGVTQLDLPPDRILENNKGQLETVLILGFDKDGDFISATNKADGGEVLWLLELCKHRLMQIAFEEE